MGAGRCRDPHPCAHGGAGRNRDPGVSSRRRRGSAVTPTLLKKCAHGRCGRNRDPQPFLKNPSPPDPFFFVKRFGKPQPQAVACLHRSCESDAIGAIPTEWGVSDWWNNPWSPMVTRSHECKCCHVFGVLSFSTLLWRYKRIKRAYIQPAHCSGGNYASSEVLRASSIGGRLCVGSDLLIGLPLGSLCELCCLPPVT